MRDQVAGHCQGPSDLVPPVAAGIGFDRGDDDVRAFFQFNPPGFFETRPGCLEDGFRAPGPHAGHARPGCRYDLHAELDTQQPADVIDELPERSLVGRFQFPVALSECPSDRLGIGQARIEHAVGAPVTEHRVEADRADRDHQVRLDQLGGQIHSLSGRRRGQVLPALGLVGIVDLPRDPAGDIPGQSRAGIGRRPGL